MKNVEVTKAAGIDKISGKFLKYGARIWAKSLIELCNPFMTIWSFLEACIVAKVKPLFKKSSKMGP